MDAVSIADRVLPHSLDAERAVLGAILVDAKAWAHAASTMRDVDFFRDAHRRIFVAMRALVERSVAVDFVTLREELQRSGILEECGGPAYLASLSDGVPHALNVENYASIVREKARLRNVIFSANRAVAAAYEAKLPAATVADDAVNQLTAAIGADVGGTVTAAAAVQSYGDALASGTAGQALLTGFVDVDDLVGGFRPADLVIVAARPSAGKTSWMLGAAQHMARAGAVVLFFTLETTPHGLASRLLAWRSGVPAAATERGTASQSQYERFSAAWGALVEEDVPLIFEPTASTMTEIGAWCRRVKQERGSLGCVVIDYLQLLLAEGRHESQQAEIAAISRSLKRLGKELQLPVVALSQLSRAPEGRADKRPHLSDLRGSGALEQDADIGILLFRPEMHKRTDDNAGIAEVIVAKHRNGPTGVLRLAFDSQLAKFSNLATGACS